MSTNIKVLDKNAISSIETVEYPSIKRLIVKKSIDTAKTHDFKDDEFRLFLINLITKRGNVTLENAELIFDDQAIQLMKIAFTHPSMLEEKNYEFYELMGDVTLNKVIMWYLYRRIPTLKSAPNSAMIMTELKKVYISKKIFSPYSKKLGFDKFIRWKQLTVIEKNLTRDIIMDDSMLEDVFEAFCGALEDLIDSKIIVNSGMSIIYNIISSIMDEINIVTNLEELFDPKTQIKEIVEDSQTIQFIDETKGYKLKYSSSKSDYKWIVKLEIPFKKNPCPTERRDNDKPFIKVFTSYPHNKVVEAEKEAAQNAIQWFKRCNINWKSKW